MQKPDAVLAATMTPAEMKRADEWFETHLRAEGRGICPVCKTDHWNLNRQLIQMPLFGRGKFTLGGPVMVYLVLSCSTCHNTFFIDALASKIADVNRLDVTKAPDLKEVESGES